MLLKNISEMFRQFVSSFFKLYFHPHLPHAVIAALFPHIFGSSVEKFVLLSLLRFVELEQKRVMTGEGSTIKGGKAASFCRLWQHVRLEKGSRSILHVVAIIKHGKS